MNSKCASLNVEIFMFAVIKTEISMVKSIFVFFCFVVFSCQVFANECFSDTDIKNLFGSSPDAFCGGFKIDGSSAEFTYDGEIDIKSIGLFNKIAGDVAAGVATNGKLKFYENTDRKNLAEDREKTRNCNLAYANMKMEMLKNKCKK